MPFFMHIECTRNVSFHCSIVVIVQRSTIFDSSAHCEVLPKEKKSADKIIKKRQQKQPWHSLTLDEIVYSEMNGMLEMNHGEQTKSE